MQDFMYSLSSGHGSQLAAQPQRLSLRFGSNLQDLSKPRVQVQVRAEQQRAYTQVLDGLLLR